jgi:hypothetical protein
MKSMRVPQRTTPLTAGPDFITGPKTLVAVINFYPIVVADRKNGKAKITLPAPQENQLREYFQTSINTLATNLLAVLQNKPGARVKAGRVVNWARSLADKEIADWREHGRFITQQYFNEHDMAAPMLKWAHLDITCYYPNFISRDVHGLSPKEIIDGCCDAGMMADDKGLISITYGKGGVDTEDPRYEFRWYGLELTAAKEALLVKTVPQKRANKRAA